MRPKEMLRWGVILFLFCVSLAFSQSKIAIVDSQKILSTYAGAIDANKELDAENQKWAQEIQQFDDELRKQQEELERQSLLLSEAKRQEREQEIQKLAADIQKYREEKWGENGEYFRKQQELMRPVFDKINEAINQVAEDEKYDFILDTVQGNVLYAKEKYDATQLVIDILESEAPASSSGNR
jgi:outer membrane protein